MERHRNVSSTLLLIFRNQLYLRLWKRLLDLVLAVFLAVTFSWLFLLICGLYLLNGYTKIIFSQERIGYSDRIFILYKFRTLLGDTMLPIEERKFGFGSFLRRASIDELPQIWNILKGEMSFIGPRPLPIEYLPHFSATQRERHLVRPGITGLAQVNGRHTISWQEKFDYDVYYVHNVSFLLDLKILLKTIALLVSLRKDYSLQEEKFKGNA